MATKAELEARIAELEAQLTEKGSPPTPAAPSDPSFVEEVLYQSDFRSNRINFPWREAQLGRQAAGQRPPMAEFSPAGDKGLYRTQDPKEIEWLDHLVRNYPHLRELSRSMVPRDPFGGSPALANVPNELKAELNKRSTINPLLEGEPV